MKFPSVRQLLPVVIFSSFLFAFTTEASSQEIDVTGKNISITSGSSSTTKKNDTFFGEAVSTPVAGQEVISNTFTITNSGLTDLNLALVTSSNPDFTISAQPNGTVVPGGTTTFTIDFNPSITGTIISTITIPNNDADEGPYTFDLRGVGIAPRVARYVHPSNADPGTVVLNGVTYNTDGVGYATIQEGIDVAGTYDIVYVADATYTNPNENAGNTNCSIASILPTPGGQDPVFYIDVNKSNIIITSQTGDYSTSAAILEHYGFNITTPGSNVVIQGFDMQDIRVNAFWNSNCCSNGPTSDVRILNNSIVGTRGHGIKTDSWGSGEGSVIDRGAWEIVGNNFQNIGSYTSSAGCTPGAVSAMWLAEAGGSFYIADNNIDGTNWAGVLLDGYGDSSTPANGAATIHNNTINNTVDAGIQIGWTSTGNFYIPDNAFITDNTLTNCNTSNKVGIGAITLLQSNIAGVEIYRNNIQSSFNGIAIEIAGWQGSPDVTHINYNDIYNLAGGFAITHIAGIAPNGLFGTGDDLGQYDFSWNYYGAVDGPTYATNPGGTGWALSKDLTDNGGTPYSEGEYDFHPYNTAAGVLAEGFANRGPTVKVPTSQSTSASVPIGLGGPSIVDPDGDDQSVTISASAGLIDIDLTGTSATITAGADNSGTVTVDGTFEDIVTILNSAQYDPNGEVGANTVTVATTDVPTLTGAPASDSDAYTINVSATPSPTTYPVGNNNDSGAGSLRQAILDANSNAGAADVIDLTGLTPGTTINLTSPLPDITDDLTILGPLGGGVILPGNSPVHNVTTLGVDLTLSDVTITGGSNTTGAGINFNQPGAGGGILTLTRVRIQNNIASVSGGGIYYDSDGVGSSITESLIVNNDAPTGAGIHINRGEISITNTTIGNNLTSEGILVDGSTAGTVNLSHVTVSGNADRGVRAIGGGLINAEYSIFYGNTSSDVDAGPPADLNYLNTDNIVGTQSPGTATNDPFVISTNPLLAAITTNGDHTDGFLPGLAGSAVDGHVNGANTQAIDQAGTARPERGSRDLGALEVINSIPTASDFTLVFGVGDISPIVEADLGYNDADGDSFASIEIVTLPGAGTLFLDLNDDGINDGGGETLAATDVISSANLAANRLKYEATTTAGSETFTFTVNDGFDDSTPANTATLYSVENALDFDGVDNFVETPNDAAFGFDRTDAFSIEMWVSTSDNSIRQRLVDKNNVTNGYYVDLTSLGEFSFYMRDNAANEIEITSLITVVNDTWYHLAVTYDGSNVESGMHMYVNGVEVALSVTTGTLTGSVVNTENLNLGRDISNSNFLNGSLDELRIWNDVRTPAEIRANAASRYANPTADASLVLYYDFNQGVPAGTNAGELTAVDLSSNGNDGTLTSFALTGATSNWVSSTAFAAAQPNIRITEGGLIEIPNGGDYLFGTYNIRNGAADSETIIINNDGLADLNIAAAGSIALTGTDFSLDVSGLTFPLTIAPGTNETFSIDFSAPAGTALSASETLTVTSDDPADPNYAFAVEGYVVENTVDFDGVDNSISVGNVAELDFERTDPFTIEFWFNATVGSTQTLIEKINANTGYIVQLFGPGQLRLLLGDGTNVLIANVSGLISTNTWYHAAFVYDGSSDVSGIHIYLNGVDRALTTAGSTPLTGSMSTATGFDIGSVNGASDFFNGEMDELMVWNDVRTPEEIRANAAFRFANPSADASLVLYYDFNDGIPAGTNAGVVTATDLSSAGNDGTLTNFTLTGATSNWLASTAFASPAATTPNMVVTESSTVITDGGSAYDYGAQTLLSDTDVAFTITNQGLADLNLTAAPSLNDGTNYSIQSGYSAATIVGPGLSQPITVRYTPTTAATHLDYVIMASNDAATDPYELNLTGVGQNLVEISSATWLDSNSDGNIDQLQLDFSETVNITDGGTAGDGFPAIVISGGAITINNVDLSGASFDAITTLTLNVSGATGTADPGVTVTYDEIAGPGNTTASIVGSQEIVDGAVAQAYVDAASPVVLSAITQDTDGNGFIDEIFVTMSEVIDASTLDEIAAAGVTDDFSVAGYQISGVLPNAGTGVDDDEIVISITEGGVINPDTDSTPQVDLVVSALDDIATPANSSLVYSAAAQDFAGPAIVSAVTDDTDGDGRIDEILVTFSEIIDATTLDETANPNVTDDFTVTGYNILSVTPVAGTGVDDDEVIIVLNEGGSPDTGATPVVTLTLAAIGDGVVPSLSPAYSANATDGASPVITAFNLNANNSFVDVTFSEVVNTAGGGPVVVSDFDITNFNANTAGGLTNISQITISDVVKNDGADTPLDGTESIIRVNLVITGNPDTDDEIEIQPDQAVVDRIGDLAATQNFADQTETTGTITLNQTTSTVFVSATSATDNTYVDLVFNTPVDDNGTAGGGVLRFDNDGNGDAGREIQSQITTAIDALPLFDSFGAAGSSTYDDPDGSGATVNITGNTGDISLIDQGGKLTWRLPITVTGIPTGNESFYIFPSGGDEVRPTTSGFQNMSATEYIQVFLADETANTFTSAIVTYYDVDEDGNIDEVLIETEDDVDDASVNAAIANGDFSIGVEVPQSATIVAAPVNADDPQVANDNFFTLEFFVDGTFTADPLTFVAGILEDDAGNTFTGSGDVAMIDRARPIVITGATGEAVVDGILDVIDLEISEDVAGPGVAGGYDVDGGSQTIGTPVLLSSSSIRVPFSGSPTFNTTETPSIQVYASAFTDLAGNNFNGVAGTPDDGAAPFAQLEDADADMTYDNYPRTYLTLSPTLLGRVDDPGSLVFVQVDGSGTLATVDGSGNWTANVTLSDKGTYDVDVTTFDSNGNIGSEDKTYSNEIEIDGGVLVGTTGFPTTIPDIASLCILTETAVLPDLVFTEQATGDFLGSGDFLLQLPTGFLFDTDQAPTFDYNGDATPEDVTVTYAYIGNAILQLTFTLETPEASAGIDELDIISIGNLHIIARAGAAPNAGTQQSMTRISGSADIFGASTNGVAYATMTAFVSPLPISDINVPTQSLPGVTEFAERVNTPFTINITSEVTAGNTITWYNEDNSIAYQAVAGGVPNGAIVTEAELNGAYFDNSVSGLYTLRVSQTNGDACESTPLEFNILIFDDNDQDDPGSPSFITRTYNNTDAPDNIYLSNPAGHTITVSSDGSGLATISNGDPLQVEFDPGVAGVKSSPGHIISYNVRNNATGATYVLSREYTVRTAGLLFTSSPINDECSDDPAVSVVILDEDNSVQFNAPTTSIAPFLEYVTVRGIRYGANFNLDGNDLHTGTQTLATTAPAGIITGAYTFTFDPTDYGVPTGDFENVYFESVITDVDGVKRVGPTEYVLLYGEPFVDLSNVTNGTVYCSDDTDFNLQRNLSYVSSINDADPANPVASYVNQSNQDITNGYELWWSPDNGITPFTMIADFTVTAPIDRNRFYPGDPDQNGTTFDGGDTNDVGFFELVYATSPLGDESCAGSVTKAIQVYDQPDMLTLDPADFSAVGGILSTQNVDEYLLEICQFNNLPSIGLSGVGSISLDYTTFNGDPITGGSFVYITRNDPFDPLQDGSFSGAYTIITSGTTDTDDGTTLTFQNIGTNVLAGDYINVFQDTDPGPAFVGRYRFAEITSFSVPTADVTWYNGSQVSLPAFENQGVIPSSALGLNVSTTGSLSAEQLGLEFYFSTTSSDGCESELRKVTVNVFGYPEAQELNLTASQFDEGDVQSGSNTFYTYELDYCTATDGGTDAIPENLVLPTLASGDRYYINTYFNSDVITNPTNYSFVTGQYYTTNTINISANAMAGGQSYQYDIRLVSNQNVGTGFNGCFGYTTRVFTHGHNTPSAPSALDFTAGVTDFHVAEGSVLSPIFHANVGMDEYYWYEENNRIAQIGSELNSGEAMSVNTLKGLTTPGKQFLVNVSNETLDAGDDAVNDVYTYYVSRLDNIVSENNFDGCESVANTPVTITVHPKQAAPSIVSDNSPIPALPAAFPDINKDGDALNDSPNGDYYFAVCLDQVDGSLLFNASQGLFGYYTNLSGTFEEGELITGASSGATAYITTDNAGELMLRDVTGTFTLTEEIEGASSTATADIQSTHSYGGASSHYVWYAHNGTTRQSRLYDNTSNTLDPTGANPTFSNLQIGSITSAAERYIEVVQITDTDVFSGTEGESVLIHIEFFDQDDLTFTAISDGDDICHDDTGDGAGTIQMALESDGSPATGTLLTYSVVSSPIDFDDATFITDDTGTNNDGIGNPIIDIAGWHAAAGGATVGGVATTHTITMNYIQANGGCEITNTATITIHPDPDISFRVAGIDINDVNFAALYDEFCYEDGLVGLQGILSDGTPLTGGSFTSSETGALTTNNGFAQMNPLSEHNAANGVGGTAGEYLNQSTTTITYSYTDGFGCQRSVNVPLYINPEPEVYDVERDGALPSSDLAAARPTNRIRLTNFCADASTIDAEIQFVDPTDTDPGDIEESDYSAYTFEWTIGGQPVPDVAPADGLPDPQPGVNTLSFTPPGNSVNISVVVTDASGCAETFTETHTLQNLPNLDIVGITDMDEFCTSFAGTINPTVTDATTDGDGATNTVDQNIISWTVDSYTSIDATIRNVDGGTNTPLPTIDASQLLTWHNDVNLASAGVDESDGVGGPITYHTITVTYTDDSREYQGTQTLCTNTRSETIIVNPLPEIDFTVAGFGDAFTGETGSVAADGGYSDHFCYDNGTVNLIGITRNLDGTIGSLPAGVGSFSTTGGVTNTGNALATWSPILANGSDPHALNAAGIDITFTFTDGSGCQSMVTKTLFVDPLPNPIEVTGDQITFDEICAEGEIIARVPLLDPAAGVEVGTGASALSYSDFTFDWTSNNEGGANDGGTNDGFIGALDVVSSQIDNQITFTSRINNETLDKEFTIRVRVTDNLTGCSWLVEETHEIQELPELNFTTLGDITDAEIDASDFSGADIYCWEDVDQTLAMFTNAGEIGVAANTDIAELDYQIDSYVMTNGTIVRASPDATISNSGNPTLDFDVLHGSVGGIEVGGDTTVHVVTMTYTDVNDNQYQGQFTNCLSVNTTAFLIYPRPNITFAYEADLDDLINDDPDFVEVCYDDASFELQGLLADLSEIEGNGDGNFTISNGQGVGNTNSSNVTLFDPSDAHDGFHGTGVGGARFLAQSTNVVTFEYVDEFGCSHSVSKTILVNPSPEVEGTIGNQIVYDAICLEFPIEAHVVVYQPGTTTEVTDYTDYDFTWTLNTTLVQSVEDNNFVTFVAQPNNLSVNMVVVVTSPDGCTTTISDTDAQGFPPIPSFTYVGITENSPLGLDVNFFEDNLQLAETSTQVGLNYLLFTMTGITGTTVVPDIERTATFGVDAVDLSPINLRTVFPGNEINLEAGTYEAELTLGTYDGCLISTGPRVITILPTFDLGDPITGGGYTESFELNEFDVYDDHWYVEVANESGKGDTRQTSWRRTTLPATTDTNDDILSTKIPDPNVATNPPLIDNTFMVTNAMDGTTSYYSGEVSYVYSPAFDYRQYANPALSFDYIRDFDSNRDGVVVQLSDDDGRTWTTLGDNDINSGINWYTHQGISAGPGAGVGRSPETGINDDLVGFADVDLDAGENPVPVWKEARHQISEGNYQAGTIRYRFALGAISGNKIVRNPEGDITNIADGFAFDNFEIYEINKLLLVEQFSSTLSADSKANETFINDGGVDLHEIDWEQGTQGVWINYYTDMENQGSVVDPINARNKVDPATRASYYGISGVPDTRIAGEDVPYDLDQTPEDFGNGFNAISLRDADFVVLKNHPTEPDAIVINPSDNDVLSVSVTFTSVISPTEPVSEAEIGFFFAVVEKERTVTSGEYDNETIRYPLRVLLPGPEGAYYRGPIVNGQEFSYDMNWTISGIDNPDNLRVIVFAQYYSHPNANKVGGVEQAAYIDADGLGKTNAVVGLEDLLTNDVLELYPNPADDKVTMKLADAPLKPVLWRISDQSGKEVLTGRIERGIKEVTIDTDELPSGMYIIQIFNDQNSWIPKKVIISH